MATNKPGKGRAPYIDVTLAGRSSIEAAIAGDLTKTEWKVVSAVWWFTLGWSKLEDAVYHAQIAERAGLRSPDGTVNEERVSKAIRSIRKKAPDVFEYVPGGGSRGVEGQDVSYPSRFYLPKARGSVQAEQGGQFEPSKGVSSDPPTEVIEPEEINPRRVDPEGYIEATGKTVEFLDALAAILNGSRRAGLPAEWADTSTALRRRLAKRLADDQRSARAIAKWAGDQADLNKVRSIPAYVDRCLELANDQRSAA